MKALRGILPIVVVISSLAWSAANPCTTVVVSGRVTVDGRPLLMKHRDTDSLQNRLMFFDDGRYEYIGLVNSSDTKGEEVWAGCNSAGFAIMNAATYNLNIGDTTSVKDREGFIMKQALQSCASLADFERLLRELPKPMGADANFGVMDVAGGAAYYETSNYDFTRFDANDPSTAPFGYIVRTNYAYTGIREKDFGLIRYQTADDLMYQASMTDALSYRFLITRISRCLEHSLTGVDLTEDLPPDSGRAHFVFFRDFICRYSSSASVIVQGVRRGESPGLATIWTILGFPLCSVTIPVWVSGGATLPEVLSADQSGNAPLCDMALRLKKECFPMTRGSGRSYLDLAALVNREKNGILQRILPIEDDILREADEKLERWREEGIRPEQVQRFYRWVDETVLTGYHEQFGLEP